MNIRYKFILFTILISFQYSFGQFYQKKKVLNNENFDKPPLSWGYFLGFNSYDFNFDYVNNRSDIQTEKSTKGIRSTSKSQSASENRITHLFQHTKAQGRHHRWQETER